MLDLILTAFLFFSRAEAVENPSIRVRLESSLERLQVEGLGVQIHGREKSFQMVAIPQRQRIEIRRESMAGHSVWRVERNGSVEIVSEPFLLMRSIEMRAGSKLLPTQVFLAPQKKSQFDVIGVLPLENYLVGVIASEMPLSWPLETLKAQAIAARSYALVSMRERQGQVYHVESSILDQVFTHIGNGPDDSALIAKAKEAVHLTEGQVLYDPQNRNRILKAYYHSDCGGKTASAKAVWGYGSPLGGAIDESCPIRPKSRWSLQLSQEALTERIKKFLRQPQLGFLQNFRLIRPSSKDRVEKIQLFWESGKDMLVSAQDFRAAIGFEQMRSTLFEVEKKANGYQFSGSGFGHGVGLCQWGARRLGQLGRSSQEILAHYYPFAPIQKLGFRTEQKLEVQTR